MRSLPWPVAALALLLLSCRPEQGNEVQAQAVRTITAVLDTIIQDWEGQDEFAQRYQDLTGVRLEIVQPPHQLYMDKLLLQLSSGDLPDICEVLPEYLPSIAGDRVAESLNSFISASVYARDVPAELLESLRFPDGTIYGFPARDGGGCVTYIRKDWLDRLGLNVPQTWNELTGVFEAFTKGDPDGNGINDTYGYTDVNAASEDWYNRPVFLSARSEIYFDGELWVDGFTQDLMADALKRLKDLYDRGLIDPDFFTNTTFSARTKFFNGEAGVITYWANHWARNLTERTRSTVGDQAEVLAIPAVEGGRYISRIAPLLVITRGAEDPEFVFHNFIDLQYDRGPVQTLFTYGVEGYHWDMTDDGPVFRVNQEDPYKAPFTKAFVPPIAVLNGWDQPMEHDPLEVYARDILREDPYYERLKIGGEAYSRYYLTIERELKPEIIARVVTGDLSIEEGLDEYRRRSSELSLDSILEELNGKL